MSLPSARFVPEGLVSRADCAYPPAKTTEDISLLSSMTYQILFPNRDVRLN